MGNNTLWLLLSIAIILDICLSAIRASLVNARLPYLAELHGPDPERIKRTADLVSKAQLRFALRLALLLIHFATASVIVLILVVLPSTPLLFWQVILIAACAALVIFIFEFLVENHFADNAEVWAIRFTGVGLFLEWLLRPVTTGLVKLAGGQNSNPRRQSMVTDDDLKTWVESGQPEGSLEKEERQMIYSIFHFGDTLCREIMVPRIDVFALSVSIPLDEAVGEISRSGHSRVPVYDGSIDNVVGMLYAKDLLKAMQENDAGVSLRPFLRQAYFVPEAKKVEELLKELRERRNHMAVVVDEYGGMAGLVSLEDIVEEIVGEIRDEYDQAEEALYQAVGENEYIFQGRVDLNTFNEITDAHLTNEVADTLGGVVYALAGRVPAEGEEVEVDGWNLTVTQVSGRRILKIRASRQKKTGTEGDKDES
jgi:putative hemolysin